MNVCIGCGKTNLTYFDEPKKILQCKDCDEIQLEEAYTPKIHYKTYDSEATRFKKSIRQKKNLIKQRIITREYIKYLKEKTEFSFKTSLDIGANLGVFVKELYKMGVDSLGIEADQKMVKLGVTDRLKWGYFDENYKPEGKFDLVTLTQVITYHRDPLSLLAQVKEILTDKGIIFIATINPSSSLLKKMDIDPSGANVVLSKKNFETLKEKIGLRLIDYQTFRTDYYLDLTAGKDANITNLKYYLNLKKAYVPDRNGNHAFLLLQPI